MVPSNFCRLLRSPIIWSGRKDSLRLDAAKSEDCLPVAEGGHYQAQGNHRRDARAWAWEQDDYSRAWDCPWRHFWCPTMNSGLLLPDLANPDRLGLARADYRAGPWEKTN